MIKRQFNDLKSVKAYLRTLPKVKLSDGFILKDKNVKSFIKNFLVNYNAQFHTVFAVTGKQQTYRSARRSAHDIYCIASFYFPRLTLTTLYNTLLELCANGGVSTNICTTVNRRVYWYTGYNKFKCVPTDELSVDITQFENWLKVIGVHSETDSYEGYLQTIQIPKVN